MTRPWSRIREKFSGGTRRELTVKPVAQPTIVALVPAHNEADVIAACLDSFFAQTMMPDVIVVIADNCTDDTVAIASSYGSPVVVMETVDNHLRKVGAMTQGWMKYGQHAKFVLGVDADTRLDPFCTEQLFTELSENAAAGGIMARYTFDQATASGFIQNYLLRQQRMEFTGWTLDLLRRDGETYVLGGQATLFRGEAMHEVVKENRRAAPWSTQTQVEDMELTWRFSDLGWETLCSPDSRAYIGPMYSVKTLWAQRRKWDAGIIHLLRANGFKKHTAEPWKLQAKMLLDTSIRVLFVILLTLALHRGSWVWYWIWAIPPLIAMALNFRIARKMPNHTKKDILYAVLLLPGEIYLCFSIAIWVISWFDVLVGKKRDGWSAQYRAEGKGSIQ
jgi:cellulose synthase/poly-beta-1,6-N-acetylglucosamine synthase-like glycosyltransferase